MARIRPDLDGHVMAFRRDAAGRARRSAPVYLGPGDEVPADVVVQAKYLAAEEPQPPHDPPAGGGDSTVPGPPADPSLGDPHTENPDEMPEGWFDPAGLTVDEVNDRLDGAPLQVVQAVFASEEAGKKRRGILAGPHADRLATEA